MEKLNTSDLINAIAEKSGMAKTEAELLVRNFIELIEEGLEKDGEVKVKGLGAFKLKRVAGRVGRNLQTNEEVEIPPHNKVIFTPQKDLKELVNKDYLYLTYKEAPEQKGGTTEKKHEEKEIPKTEKEEEKPEEIKKEQETPIETKADTPKPEPVKKEKAPPPPPPPPPKEEKTAEEKPHRNYLWIIPVVILVIAILAVIFYFRACNGTSQEEAEPPEEQIITTPEDETEAVDTDPADTLQGQEPEVEEPRETERAEPAPIGPEEELLYVLEPGNYLYQLAGQFYGDSLFWVLIYKANAGKIADPEEVNEGGKLVIPPLEGKPGELTRKDSLNLSEGYRMLYEYYMVEEDPRTSNFYFGMVRYMPR